jgi:DNA repair protein RecO (recombination protein O)
MKEYYTRALVLGTEDIGEADLLVHLFTEECGKVIAKARGIRKIKSKSAGHIQPLRFARVRFVSSRRESSNNYILMDVLWDDSIYTEEHHDFLSLIRVLDVMTPESQPEPRLWSLLETAFSKPYKPSDVGRVMLQILGHNPQHQVCARCGKKETKTFVVLEELFLCAACASQLPTNTVQLDV